MHSYGILYTFKSIALIFLMKNLDFIYSWQRDSLISYLIFVCVPGLIAYSCLISSGHTQTYRKNAKWIAILQLIISLILALFVVILQQNSSKCALDPPFAYERLIPETVRKEWYEKCLLEA